MRRSDFSLSDRQVEFREVVSRFFQRECSPEVVRAAEPIAFDAQLWEKVRGSAAPLPFVEHVVATRAMAASAAPEVAALWISGDRVLGFAPLGQRS